MARACELLKQIGAGASAPGRFIDAYPRAASADRRCTSTQARIAGLLGMDVPG